MTSKVFHSLPMRFAVALGALLATFPVGASAQQRRQHPGMDDTIRRPDAVRRVAHQDELEATSPITSGHDYDHLGPVHAEAWHGHGAACGCGGHATCGGCNQCGSCCACGPSGFWLRGEYLMFWTSGMRIPPLVTTTTSDDPQAVPALGDPETVILVGNEDLLDEMRNGIRIRGGLWFDDCRCFGIEAEYFGIENDDYYFHANGFDYSILGRPYFNVNPSDDGPPAEFVQDVAVPDVLAGAVTVTAHTELHSAGVRLRFNRFQNDAACNDPCAAIDHCISRVKMNRLDFLAGYRFLYLSDQLRIHEELVTLGTGPNFAIDVRDDFFTRNEFHGGELGLLWEHCRDRWSFEFLAKVALGSNRQRVRIQGYTQNTAGGTATHPGGLLAQPSNMGIHERSEFSAIPEFGATFFYHMNDCMRLSFGYTFIYWGNVVRPGEQIDRRVNEDFLDDGIAQTGPQLPAFNFRETDFWIQGLSFGFDYRF